MNPMWVGPGSNVAPTRPSGAERRKPLPQPLAALPTAATRPKVDGKLFEFDGRPFRLRGATYGSFRPRADGHPFPEPQRVLDDFVAMAEAGLNTIRTYSLPPADVIDLAEEAGLLLIVGLDYRDWRMEGEPGRRSRRRIRDAGLAALDAALASCADRASVLALSVGNEVPADLVRLHGPASVEETLGELCAHVRESGSGLLATYTNFPTTEYLHVEGQDFVSFNVFLEQPETFHAYLRHLQIVAGSRPLVITELGLAAEIHGAEAQADTLAWQLQLADECGCAGATIFAWTDEWSVAGKSVMGWGFGLTDAERRPKPALEVVRAWSRSKISDLRGRWPRVSVVVCARNEEEIVSRCLASLTRCEYPELEVIFCDDGSTDRTLELARRFPFRVLALEHGGLSRARNAGLHASTGEIVAYLDADAECHPEWPYYLALSLEDDCVVATGGPNIAPEDAPFAERVVDQAPGGPIHVLVSDDRAEHVPGCNMAFRREALEAIGGFDPVFRAAGDDVDVCWKLLDRGDKIAFAPVAQVRHHRPATFRAYLRQQRSYGRSERMLHGRHGHRFNRLGQARWAGSIYGGPPVLPSLLRPIVYHGPMGLAPFQTVEHRPADGLLAVMSSLLPLAAPFALLGALAPLSPLFLAFPALALITLVLFAATIAVAVRPSPNEPHRLRLRLAVGALHVAQPFVRTWGRLRGRPVPDDAAERQPWSGDRATWLNELRQELAVRRCRVRPGGPHDGFDLVVSIGPLLACRVWTAVAWRWMPLQRTQLRPRAPSWLLAASAVVAGVLDPMLGSELAGAIAIGVLVELWRLRKAIRDSLRVTTQGAAAPTGVLSR